MFGIAVLRGLGCRVVVLRPLQEGDYTPQGSPPTEPNGSEGSLAAKRHLAEIASLLCKKRSDPCSGLRLTARLDLVSQKLGFWRKRCFLLHGGFPLVGL
jgi:hypothetical protein